MGRISRYGIIPITADQDTAGPMAKTVTDAAIMLGALEGAAPDPSDPATQKCAVPPMAATTAGFSNRMASREHGSRIPRAFYYDPVVPPGEKDAGAPGGRQSQSGTK